jgi:hypothetical protein
MADPTKATVSPIAAEWQKVQNFAKESIGSFNAVISPESKRTGDNKRAEQLNYKYDYINFPKDLGRSLRHPYYITFFINLQDLSKFKKSTKIAIGKNGQPIQSNVQINQRGIRTLGRNLPGNNTVGFGRKTSRTALAIRLFMPDSLSWGYQNSFKDVSLSGLPYAAALHGTTAIGQSMVDGFKKGGAMGVLSELAKNRNVSGPLAEFVGNKFLGADGEAVALSALGLAVNPQLDVIYESPTLRDFSFDFLFAPRNQDEAKDVAKIVKEFKFHASPELYGAGSGVGRYFVPPSEFDIEFSVPTMGRISTCVLQNITLDYAQSGAAFYEDNYPVYTRMTLKFKELEFMTKELIEDKDY